MHLTSFPEPIPGVTPTDDERVRWETMLSVRQLVSKALEEARAQKRIGSSLEARVTIEAPKEVVEWVQATEDSEGFFIVSQLETVARKPARVLESDEEMLSEVNVTVSRADGTKCSRCWMWTKDVGVDKKYPEICGRCAGVMAGNAGTTATGI